MPLLLSGHLPDMWIIVVGMALGGLLAVGTLAGLLVAAMKLLRTASPIARAGGVLLLVAVAGSAVLGLLLVL